MGQTAERQDVMGPGPHFMIGLFNLLFKCLKLLVMSSKVAFSCLGLPLSDQKDSPRS